MVDKKEILIKYLKEQPENYTETIEGYIYHFEEDEVKNCKIEPYGLGNIINNPKESCMDFQGKRFLVLDDIEADNVAKSNISESIWAFESSFLSLYINIPDKRITDIKRVCGEDCNDLFLKVIECNDEFDDFVDNAIASDGRGHFITYYNGKEHEITFDDKEYYIYRTE